MFKPSSDPKMHQRIRGATRTLCSLLAGEELMNKHYVCLFISAFKTPLFPTFHLPVSQHMKLAGRTQRPNATPAIVSVLGLHHDPWIVGLAPCQEGQILLPLPLHCWSVPLLALHWDSRQTFLLFMLVPCFLAPKVVYSQKDSLPWHFAKVFWGKDSDRMSSLR
jgi:hypothetical protein